MPYPAIRAAHRRRPRLNQVAATRTAQRAAGAHRRRFHAGDGLGREPEGRRARHPEFVPVVKNDQAGRSHDAVDPNGRSRHGNHHPRFAGIGRKSNECGRAGAVGGSRRTQRKRVFRLFQPKNAVTAT